MNIFPLVVAQKTFKSKAILVCFEFDITNFLSMLTLGLASGGSVGDGVQDDTLGTGTANLKLFFVTSDDFEWVCRKK